MRIRRLISLFTVVCLMAVQFTAPAWAGVVGTQEYLQAMDRQVLIEQVETALDREQVRDALIAHGVDPADALDRVHSLNDAELALLADELDSMPAGGSLLAIIGVVFVVLLILELVGVTNVFTHT